MAKINEDFKKDQYRVQTKPSEGFRNNTCPLKHDAKDSRDTLCYEPCMWQIINEDTKESACAITIIGLSMIQKDKK
jgi:hypothetical protein